MPKSRKRRRAKHIANHCVLCGRAASPGHPMCLRCYRLPRCAGRDCFHGVNLAGDVCPTCREALGLPPPN